MTVIIVLIAISLSVALLFLGLFLWNIRSGQYEDVYTPSVRMLFDEKAEKIQTPEEDQKIPSTDV
ncbi:MAG TPA: cbb3-type cytochrome oxidase assembly protein CcoS [Cyclobacteriaceae bacterium]|nr:cbb3-type cytochrome oxidase assembly protein CcoS [Cyclobacteriaceae bacterium]